jgi:hypothetical protein
MAAKKKKAKKPSKSVLKPKKTQEKTPEPSKSKPKGTKIDWRPAFIWIIAVIVLGFLMYFAVGFFFPKPTTSTDELVGTYGPYDVYKVDDHHYYMQINPELIWHMRANPLDTVNIPVFPFKSEFLKAMDGVNETWIVFSAEENPRVVAAAVEISKTLGARGYEVKRGWLRQPQICVTEPTEPVCYEPIIPLDFANENRTVFRILGPEDNISSAAIYAIGNNIIVQAPDYDQLDMAADKVSLMLLNLA